MINKIQQINIVWVVGSLVLLYIGVTGNWYDLVESLISIVLLFVIMYYMGTNYKIWINNNKVVGEPAKGQWER